MVGKSPLTGGWGDANSGGFISHEIKKAGYDALFFTGAAENPVWVYVTNDRIEIKDASTLWGKDTFETEDIIKSHLNNKKGSGCQHRDQWRAVIADIRYCDR